MPAPTANVARQILSPPQDPRWWDAVNGALLDGKLDFVRLDTPGRRELFIPIVRAPSGTTEPVMHQLLDLTDALWEPACPPSNRPLQWDALLVVRVRARSELLAVLPSSDIRYALTHAGSSAFCDVSHPDALRALSKEHLRNVDRLKRRAERDFGEVAIDSVLDSSLSDAAFDRFVALEDAGWKGLEGTGTSIAADEQARRFFREVMRRFQENAHARIDFLTVGGRDAAAQLMVRAGATWFLLKIGYHPEFKHVGPGGILLKSFLEEMRDSPDIREVNLMTNPSWAARWHFQTEPVYGVHIFGSTPRGQLRYAVRLVKELLKKVRNLLRALRVRRSANAHSSRDKVTRGKSDFSVETPVSIFEL